MKFNLVDRITSVEAGKALEAEKVLSLAEEYLQDHFPMRPVMPGVIMIEAMVQAGAWLVRLSQNFTHSVIVLREARGVKYGQFVRPGDKMTVSVKMKSMADGRAQIRGAGVVDGQKVVSGRLELEYFNLAERDPSKESVDRQLVEHFRQQFGFISACDFDPTAQ